MPPHHAHEEMEHRRFGDYPCPDASYYIQKLSDVEYACFKKIIALSPEEQLQLYFVKQGQPLWYWGRSVRSTGSVSATACGVNPYELYPSGQRKVLHPEDFDQTNPNLLHGKWGEEHAAQEYKRQLENALSNAFHAWKSSAHFNPKDTYWIYRRQRIPIRDGWVSVPKVEMEESGMILDLLHLWRAVSLDRIVRINGKVVWIVEIKCPGPFGYHRLHPLLPMYYYDQLMSELYVARQRWKNIEFVDFFIYCRSQKEEQPRTWYAEPYVYNADYFEHWYLPREMRFYFCTLLPEMARKWWISGHPDDPLKNIEYGWNKTVEVVYPERVACDLNTQSHMEEIVSRPWYISVSMFNHFYIPPIRYPLPEWHMPYSVVLHVLCDHPVIQYKDTRWNWKQMRPVCVVARIHCANGTDEKVIEQYYSNDSLFTRWNGTELWVPHLSAHLPSQALHMISEYLMDLNPFRPFDELQHLLDYASRILCWSSAYTYSVLTRAFVLPGNDTNGNLKQQHIISQSPSVQRLQARRDKQPTQDVKPKEVRKWNWQECPTMSRRKKRVTILSPSSSSSSSSALSSSSSSSSSALSSSSSVSQDNKSIPPEKYGMPESRLPHVPNGRELSSMECFVYEEVSSMSGPFHEQDTPLWRKRTYGLLENIEHQLKAKKWKNPGCTLGEWMGEASNRQLVGNEKDLPILRNVSRIGNANHIAEMYVTKKWHQLFNHARMEARVVDKIVEEIFLKQRVMRGRNGARWCPCQIDMHID